MDSTQSYIFGCGNPLLDIQAVTTQDFLKKYKLENKKFCFESPDQYGLYTEIESYPGVKHIPGGSTLNSLRVCQALLNNDDRYKVFYSGCIGKDHNGTNLKDLCESEGIETYMAVSEINSTGVCGVAIVDKERYLCTRIGAANDFPAYHFNQDPVEIAFNKSVIVYSSGFFLTACSQGLLNIANRCSTETSNSKVFCINLSAEFILKSYKDTWQQLLKHVDFLFGTEQEYLIFSTIHFSNDTSQEQSITTSLADIILKIAQLPKANTSKKRYVIATRGSNSTLVAWYNSQLASWVTTEYAVKYVPEEKIIDLNSAGDGFVGGFLYGLTRCQQFNTIDLDRCVHFAHVAAANVIQYVGCSFNFKDSDRKYAPC